MAVLFLDGFDNYGPTGMNGAALLALMEREWTSGSTPAGSGALAIVAGLSTTGYALTLSSNSQYNIIGKTLASTYTRLIGGFRFNSAGLVAGGLQFMTALGGTAMCSVVVTTGGALGINTGAWNGTSIATGGSFTAGSTHFLEFDITFGSSASYQLWLDGVSVASGTGNTGNGHTAAGAIQFESNNSWGMTVDDLYLFDSTGSTNNAALNSNPRIETQHATADSSVDFSFGAAILGSYYSATSSTSAPGANELFLRQFTPPLACTIASVSCIPGATSSGANFKAVIYSDSGGSPGTLLSSGTQVTGATSGTTLSSALTSAQSLSANTPYWIGFITDTSVALQEVDATTTGVKASNTYSSGAPATAPAMTANQASWVIYGNLSAAGSNYFEVDLNPQPGDPSYVFDSNVGDIDLYNFAALSSTPAAIYTVAVKALVRNQTTGTRTVDLWMKSSGSTSAGRNSGIAPGTTYAWLDSYFDTDPNTSAAWTKAGLNAATTGLKIAS